jgi:hypothetical protein
MDNGTGLGTCGIWNFLWRLGFHPTRCAVGALPAAGPGDVLFVQAEAEFREATLGRLTKWIQQGGRIVAAGLPLAWRQFFSDGSVWSVGRCENPYAALAYLLPGGIPQLIAPPRWTFAVCKQPRSAIALSPIELVAVYGERQTPSRALISPLEGASALVTSGNLVYLNGNPFAAFQAWLQGQEDLTPWMAWRHRLFWLDEWVSFVGGLLFGAKALCRDTPRPGIKGLRQTTVVFRHDLDHSTDPSYLEEETQRHLAGTHAVLRDGNTSFWLNRLQQYQKHEVAFHYNTVKGNRLHKALRMATGQPASAVRPARKQICGRGLLRQVRWAKQRGVGIKTLHRHWSFLIYPEWIDAMDAVFDQELEVLGSSSLFRAQVLRWGVDCVGDGRGFVGDWPDAQFPLWFPFKLCHAGRGGKMLRGWETTSLMEVEPQLLSQMLDYEIKDVPQRVLTINFHPAHANQPTFQKNGSLDSFRQIMDILVEHHIAVMPLCDVYQYASQALDV